MEGVGRRLTKKDGFLLDIGQHSLNGFERNVLFRNDADGTFTEVGWVTGADRVEDGRGLALLDADGNGHVDVLLRNYRMPAGLLVNAGADAPEADRHWIAFALEGTRSNRDAVGARVRLRVGDRWQTRVVSVGSGYLSSNSLRQHFGLGSADRVDEVVIEWPSGERTVLTDLDADRLHAVREGGEPTMSPAHRRPAPGVDSQGG